MEIITFKYKDSIISTPNLEKKLKRMKISIDDIKIIDTPVIVRKKEDDDIDTSIKKYYFKNVKTGYTITSIYPELPEWLNDKELWTNYTKP